MKNFSKNNYSKKNSEKNPRRSGSKNQYKSNDFQEDRYNSGKDNTFERNNFKKRNESKVNENSYLRSKEKSRKNFIYPQRKFSSINSKDDNYAKNSRENLQINNNVRNFEDWIWGKHSVLSALNSKRPINRIWCTSDIFSSEKFFYY